MSRITIIIALFLIAPLLHAFEYYGPYSKYLVKTIGDFYTVCESLENPDSTDQNQAIKAHTCLAYVSGILVGYTSTISLGAEYELASKTGKKRSEIAQDIDSDEALHVELSQIANRNHFICNAFNVNHTELAIDVTQRLKKKNLNPNFASHYFVLNEIIEHINCGKAG